MFFDNQIVIVSGDNDVLLKKVISFLIDEMPPILGYKILEDKMCIYTSVYTDKINLIKKENATNVEYIYYLIKAYLSSDEYKKAKIKNQLDEPWNKYDGTTKEGWKVEVEHNGKYITIKPFVAFYSK